MSDFSIPSYRMRPEGNGPSRLMLLVAAGLLGVLLLGIGVAWLFTGSRSGGVPVVEADSRPVKVRPTTPGGMQVPNQEEQVLDRPGERRPEQVLPAARLAPGPEAPQLETLRRQQAATPPAAQPTPGAPQTAQPSAPQASVLPPPVPRPAPPVAAAANGRWQLQVAALPSEAAARTFWADLVKKAPELAGRQPQVSRLDRDGQPPLWRLRTGGYADGPAARAVCEALKARSIACLPVPPAP